jgi:hypothetical protein
MTDTWISIASNPPMPRGNDSGTNKEREIQMSKLYDALKAQEEAATSQLMTVLPPEAGDGFDGFDDGGDDYLPLVFCDVTKPGHEWHDRHGEPVGGQWLVTAVDSEVVYWGPDGRPDRSRTIRKQPGTPLPNRDEVDDLNAKADRSEWHDTAFGPRGPYQLQWYVFILDPAAAGRRKFVSSSFGGETCWREIRSAIANMRKLRGQPRICPIVELSLAKFGKKGPGLRPALKPVAWTEFGAVAEAPLLPAPQLTELAKPPISVDLNDEIPFN